VNNNSPPGNIAFITSVDACLTMGWI